MKQATFDTFLTGVHGGPCPICDNRGELIRDRGSYEPGAFRTLSHLNLDGFFQICTVSMDAGMVWIKDGRWWFETPDET